MRKQRASFYLHTYFYFILCIFNATQIGLMRCGKLLAESPPQKLLEQFQCSFLEEAFLKLCEGQNDAIILNETQESKAEDTGSGSELMNQDKYKQTKVYLKLIYTVLVFI